jgi:2'-5' RNA ligase
MNDQETRRVDAGPQEDEDERGDDGKRGHGDKESPTASGIVEPAFSASPRPSVAESVPARVAASALRIFYAIELPLEIRARAAEHIARLRSTLPHLRAGWERTEKLHLTLKFLGNVEESRIPALSLAAERAVSAFSPFTLTVADAGAFPPHGQPRVLWLGISDSSNTLARLQQALEDECAAAGFKREQRPFHPHITIARLRQPAGARQLAAIHKETGFPAMELTVKEIILMHSEMTPGGSRYTPLTRHSLSV